jgi:tRNA(Ile)-lysidine synthase
MYNSHKVIKSVVDSQIIEAGDSLLIGVSGGVDSVVLLDVLASIREELGLKIGVAHVNYRLRGRESDGDERFVKGLAEKYNCKFFVKHNPPRPPFNKGGKGGIRSTNLQQSARNLRYDFFVKTAKKIGANKIAVAHHADDQAETILLHLARGTGLQGLAGMTERRLLDKGISLIRPLLKFTRGDILRYAEERGLKFVEDSTNRTDKYTRNVIRNRVMPELKNVNENVVNSICNTAAILADEERYLNKSALSALKKASDAFWGDPKCIIIKRPIFMKYDVVIMKRVLRLAYARLSGSTADLLTDHLDRMLQICNSGKKEGSYSLPNGLKFRRNGNDICLKLNV